jgi:hypothetical protein
MLATHSLVPELISEVGAVVLLIGVEEAIAPLALQIKLYLGLVFLGQLLRVKSLERGRPIVAGIKIVVY